MRIGIIGDTHFRYLLPYSSAIEDGRKEEWENVKNKIIETSQDCDHVVFLGDIFNLRHNHSAVISEFVSFLKKLGGVQIHLISGNHDLYGKKTSIDFLKKLNYPNWHVYTDIEDIKLGDTAVTFLPFLTPGVIGAEDIPTASKTVNEKLSGGNILFHHHAVTGATQNGADVETWSEIILDKDIIEKKYDVIFGGHLHSPQNLGKIYITGSIFTSETGEHKKYIYTYDTDTKQVKEIALPVRGIYKITDIEKLKSVPKNSIVKCIVEKRTPEITEALESFDASVIVERGSNQREKVAIRDAKGLDLSTNNLLKIYAEEKKLDYNKLKDALDLLETYE